MAFVMYFDSSGNPVFSCSGTLVSPNVVLTAGHCAVDENTGAPLDPSGYAVVTRAVDWTDQTNREVSSVNQVIVYPLFDPSGPRHDAALLVLSTPLSDPTIPLWSSGGLSSGTSALIAGWGLLDSAQDPTNTLQWAPTVVQSVAYCRQRFYRNYPYDPYSDLCTINAPTYDTATCQGDSGGPLLAEDASGNLFELGLDSIGAANCSTSAPNYFTAIQPIESWITNESKAVAAGSTSSSPTSSASAPAGMTLSNGRSYVREALGHVFGGRFQHGHALRLSCIRMSTTRVRCNFTFWSGRNDYYGRVTVYYFTGSDGATYWASKYNTHWVNDHCYFHTTHRSRCSTHPRSGTW